MLPEDEEVIFENSNASKEKLFGPSEKNENTSLKCEEYFSLDHTCQEIDEDINIIDENSPLDLLDVARLPERIESPDLEVIGKSIKVRLQNK